MSFPVRDYVLTFSAGAILPATLAVIFWLDWQEEKLEVQKAKEAAYRATAVLELVTNAPVVRFDSVMVSFDPKEKRFRFNGIALSGGETVLGKRYTIPVGDSAAILKFGEQRVDLRGVVTGYDQGRYKIACLNTPNGPVERWYYHHEIAPLHVGSTYIPKGIQAMP